MLTYTSHIKISTTVTHSVVETDDNEIFDLLDDHFVERGIVISFVDLPDPSLENQTYRLYFEKSNQPEKLFNIISMISQDEIERIYAIPKAGNTSFHLGDA